MTQHLLQMVHNALITVVMVATLVAVYVVVAEENHTLYVKFVVSMAMMSCDAGIALTNPFKDLNLNHNMHFPMPWLDLHFNELLTLQCNRPSLTNL